MPSSLWITYAWSDNDEQDIDFLAQELGRSGLTVKLDRWNLSAGKRLWEGISDFITNPTQSDGWAIFATPRSLGSEPCREEIAYALDRALSSRGDTFPLIAMFSGPVNTDLLPASLRVRLCVSITDPDWKERIVAATERRPPSINPSEILPFVMQAHRAQPPFKYALEFRPRAGAWNPFIFAIPFSEKDRVDVAVRSGPPGRLPPIAGVVMSRGEGTTLDGKWWYSLGYEPATPINSYFAFVSEMPSAYGFGQEGTPGLFYMAEGPSITWSK